VLFSRRPSRCCWVRSAYRPGSPGSTTSSFPRSSCSSRSRGTRSCGGGKHDRAPIYHHLPTLRSRSDRDDANRRLPILLRLQRLWRAAPPQSRRLLRVLLLWLGALPSGTEDTCGTIAAWASPACQSDIGLSRVLDPLVLGCLESTRVPWPAWPHGVGLLIDRVENRPVSDKAPISCGRSRSCQA
jgi:hypothetical protein